MQESIQHDTSQVGSDSAGATRKSFLKQAGVGGAVVLGGSALLGAVAGPARAGHTDSVPDVDVLNFALTLEYLEASFYTAALGGAGTTGVPASAEVFSEDEITDSKSFAGFGGRIRSTAYRYLTDIRDHEVTHVDFLVGAIPDEVGACTFDFSAALGSVESFIATAQVLENTGVMAYDGAIRYVDAGDFLQAGAQIATVEARHAAYLNLINRESPFPNAFDMGKLPSEIITAVKATGFIVRCPSEVGELFNRLP